MCGVNEAMAVMKIGQAVMGHQAKKQVAKDQAWANSRAKMTANKAYLVDLSKIETERGMAAREKALEEFKVDQQKKYDIAKMHNLGFGNPAVIMRSIGSAADLDYNQISEEYMGDMFTLNNQTDDAYANLQRTYNSLEPVVQPSVMSLGLEIAGAGQGYLDKPASERKYFKDFGKQTDTS